MIIIIIKARRRRRMTLWRQPENLCFPLNTSCSYLPWWWKILSCPFKYVTIHWRCRLTFQKQSFIEIKRERKQCMFIWTFLSSILIYCVGPLVVKRDGFAILFSMQNKKRHNFAWLPVCGPPHWDCKPWQRYWYTWGGHFALFYAVDWRKNYYIIKSTRTTKRKRRLRYFY